MLSQLSEIVTASCKPPAGTISGYSGGAPMDTDMLCSSAITWLSKQQLLNHSPQLVSFTFIWLPKHHVLLSRSDHSKRKQHVQPTGWTKHVRLSHLFELLMADRSNKNDNSV